MINKMLPPTNSKVDRIWLQKNTILLTFLLNKLMKQTGFASSSISNDQKLKQEICKQDYILVYLNTEPYYNCYFLLS